MKESLVDDEIDWWSKYYASIGEKAKSHTYMEKGYDKMKVSENAKHIWFTQYMTSILWQFCSVSG